MADTPEITRNLLEMYGRNDPVMNFNFKFFMKISGISDMDRNSVVVDCGCGMGHFIHMLKSFGFTSVTGVDASEEMVAHARKMTGAEVILGDAVKIGDYFDEKSQDAVFVSDLLHHIASSDQWEVLLRGCSKVLKDDGLLIIREPFPIFLINVLTAMSRYRIFYLGFLKSRLQSFVEEADLLEYFYTNWVPNYRKILPSHGFEIVKDSNWLVHRITTCRKSGES